MAAKLPPNALIAWCRALRHGVDIGLPLPKIFNQQAKSGPPVGRELAATLAKRTAEGESLAQAVSSDGGSFPMLFTELVAVGERTGRLTETFETLEHYFETVVDGRRKLRAALVYPVISYFGGIFVIAAMLLVLGLIAPADGKGFDPLGLGLLGVRGALIWLFCCGSFTIAIVVAFHVIRDNETIRAKLESKLLRVPGLGQCFRSFALQRFSLGLHMTGEAGLKADESLRLSFRAACNDAYGKHGEPSAKAARKGKEIAPTLRDCGTNLFPTEYVDAVQVGEVSGRLPEIMEKQAKFYQEDAARKTKTLAMFLGGAVYALIGLMLIVLILRILMSIGGVYQDAMKGL